MSINWTQFFKDAGIPPSIAKRYCNTFEDNRISKDMLLDLNKDILTDMGVTAMGDIINIVKHAKKIHFLDTKKKDSMISIVAKTGKHPPPPPLPPPPPTAHSTTTPGQASTVSTTSSSAAKKKNVTKYAKREIPDSLSTGTEPKIAYIAFVEPDREEVAPHSIRSSNKKSSLGDYQEEYYIENTEAPDPPHIEMMEDCDYKTQQYESRLKKRSMTMYSDEPVETSQSKQPRVIILPGEGQDIFTTTALHKAAKEYESGEEQVGKVATDRSRRLLESAGLIPSVDKNIGSSVFSRLDYEPSSEFPVVIQQDTQDASSPDSRRIIKLSRGASRGVTAASSSSSSPSSKQPTRRSVISSGSPQKRKVTSTNHATRVLSIKNVPTSTSTPRVLPKRPTESRKISSRLGTATTTTRITSNMESDKLQDRASMVVSTSRGKVSRGTAKHELRAYRTTLGGGQQKPSGGAKLTVKRSTMVADEYEYQTHRQHDIRSRLEKKESEKKLRRGGPLSGRLASHNIFGRLE